MTDEEFRLSHGRVFYNGYSDIATVSLGVWKGRRYLEGPDIILTGLREGGSHGFIGNARPFGKSRGNAGSGLTNLGLWR